MQCQACAAELPEDDAFCENCGQPLHPAETKTAACICGAPAGETDQDGFCLRCGRRVLRPASDHIEESLSPLFAAVSDRGLRHEKNEDRFAIFESAGAFALVVCDGVSATRNAEIASAAVSEGALETLAAAMRSGKIDDPEGLLRQAIAAGAARLAAQLDRGDRLTAPSTTVVAALVAQGVATIGWVGDSRAYWIAAEGAVPLTHDHSWMNEVVSAGEMTLEQAEASPRAHAITRWIGADAVAEALPEIVRHPIAAPGMLLLCTDGLWNCAQTPEAFAKVVREAGGEDALTTARNLVKFANDRGGQDNITVAVLTSKDTTEQGG